MIDPPVSSIDATPSLRFSKASSMLAAGLGGQNHLATDNGGAFSMAVTSWSNQHFSFMFHHCPMNIHGFPWLSIVVPEFTKAYPPKSRISPRKNAHLQVAILKLKASDCPTLESTSVSRKFQGICSRSFIALP